MVSGKVLIEKFGQQGEKTGWTYIRIQSSWAKRLNPSNRKSFRVKGKLNEVAIQGTALLPMGDGDFILPLNATLRKQLKVPVGDFLQVHLEPDTTAYQLNEALMLCLSDDATALQRFEAMPKSYQHYYSKYIDAAKTETTRARRIAQTLMAMQMGWTYAEMLHNTRDMK